jgi:hypothetical protein
MQHLSKLLQTENSDLAWLLRISLHGMRAELQEALKKDSLDQGRSACQELLRELNDLLEPSSTQKQQSENNISLPTEFSSLDNPFEPVVQSNLKLINLYDAFVADPELHYYLGSFQLKSTTDGDLWNEIQRLLLRVPAHIANTWRHRAKKLAEEVGAYEDRRALLRLPFSRDEILYPGLSGSVQAQGLRLSNKSTFDLGITEEKLEDDLYFLAGVVCALIKFIELDSSLHHALQSIDQFCFRSLEPEQERSKYVVFLISCFKNVLAAEKSLDPKFIIRARLDLDEAIHSLVYLPPVERDLSWWGKLQQEARHTLIVKARQYNVQIRPLWGIYANIRTLSKHDLEVDIGGTKGEVSACLRVYARINQEDLPGRVLVRSLRDEAKA